MKLDLRASLCAGHRSEKENRYKRVEQAFLASRQGVIYSSNLRSTGNLWSRRVDSKAHELDGSRHGVMKLLLLKGADRKTSALLKGFWRRD